MKHDIVITYVTALNDDVLLLIFKDRTLGVYDAELVPNRIPGLKPVSDPQTMDIIRSDSQKYLSAWADEINGTEFVKARTRAEVSEDIDPAMLTAFENWCAGQNVTADKLFLALKRFTAKPENKALAEAWLGRVGGGGNAE